MSKQFEGLSANATLDDFEPDSALLDEACELDGEVSDVEAGELPSTNRDEPGVTGELVVEVMEVAIQFLGHERYQMPESKKALLTGAYDRLASKYQTKVPEVVSQFKEEAAAIVLTLIVMFGSYQSVKQLREQDSQGDKTHGTSSE